MTPIEKLVDFFGGQAKAGLGWLTVCGAGHALHPGVACIHALCLAVRQCMS